MEDRYVWSRRISSLTDVFSPARINANVLLGITEWKTWLRMWHGPPVCRQITLRKCLWTVAPIWTIQPVSSCESLIKFI